MPQETTTPRPVGDEAIMKRIRFYMLAMRVGIVAVILVMMVLAWILLNPGATSTEYADSKDNDDDHRVATLRRDGFLLRRTDCQRDGAAPIGPGAVRVPGFPERRGTARAQE